MHRSLGVGVILLICCSTACGLKLNKYKPNPVPQATTIKPLFPAELTELVFDLSISYGKNNQNSGILAIRRDSIDRSQYRTVFMAKTGLNLFDFSFTPEQMTVNKIIPQMDKHFIKKILEADLRLIMDELDMQTNPLRQLANEASQAKLYRYKKQRKHYRLSATEEGQITRIDKGKKNRSHVSMTIDYSGSELPHRIMIDHHRLPFSMQLISLSST